MYSIRWLYSQNKTIDFIANDLSLTEKQVKSAIEKFGTTSNDDSVKTKTSKSSKDLMITETSVKKSRNVSIMTKEASMQNDAAVKNNSHTRDTSGYIFRAKK